MLSYDEAMNKLTSYIGRRRVQQLMRLRFLRAKGKPIVTESASDHKEAVNTPTEQEGVREEFTQHADDDDADGIGKPSWSCFRVALTFLCMVMWWCICPWLVAAAPVPESTVPAMSRDTKTTTRASKRQRKLARKRRG
jgi:hypothetical protein